MALLPDFVANVRIDLQDTNPSSYRWQDTDLQREIDVAVDRYSYVAPRLQSEQIPTVAGCRLYPSPSGCWWVERAEWPLGRWPKNFLPFRERLSPLIAAPATAPAISLGSGGNLSSGVYIFAYTWTVPGGGETTPSPLTTVTASAGQSAATAVAPGPYGVTGCNLYRTAANGSQLKLVTRITDNRTTTALDVWSDASLGINAPTLNTTQSIPQFELVLDAGRLPSSSEDWIEVTAAYKHTLSATQNTIPEQHWDAITLGARAHALEAYLVTTNDNFNWEDGQFRDRVDDTKAPEHWHTQAADLMRQFEVRLEQIRNQMQTLTPDVPQWGDKPVRWERL